MTISKITYSKKFPTGAYLNEDIGFECSIEERENPMEVITKLRELAEQAHKEKYPHLYQEEKEVSILIREQVGELPTEKLTPKQVQIQGHIISIESYTDPQTLQKNYGWVLKSESAPPELKKAYNNRLNQLQ